MQRKIAIIISVLLSAYLLAYVSVRKIYIMDNRFLAVVYSEKFMSVYPVIELYYKNGSGNKAVVPADAKKNLYDLHKVDVLNVYEGSREVIPNNGWFLPFLFYPLEKFEIKCLVEKSG
ncbi:hypothetical protein QUF72_12160 [Desulfobacterales bacterium HSG2]|nr:hypothetical protein [Desulfobacterales bacterium HSG2]